jgi:hypothetical protein
MLIHHAKYHKPLPPYAEDYFAHICEKHSHMLFGFRESMITATIVAGRLRKRNRTVLTLNVEEVTARS